MKWALTLLLSVMLIGCAARQSKFQTDATFVFAPLPQGANAWVCEPKNGDDFEVCDAVVVKDGKFTRLAFDAKVAENIDAYLRIVQSDGIVVYWRKSR